MKAQNKMDEAPFLIDTHCHLDLVMARFPECSMDQMLAEALEEGIHYWISVATSLPHAHQLLDQFQSHPSISTTAGIHPCDLGLMDGAKKKDWCDELASLAKNQNICAIGECGLDFTERTTHAEKNRQQEVFDWQLEIAQEVQKPIIIHCRNAFEPCFQMLRDRPQKAPIFHCFTGNTQEAKKALDLGAWLSFSGILTFKNAKAIQEAACYAPLDRILVETDAPYLAPEPHRGSINRPCFMRQTANFLAKLRGLSFYSMAQQLSLNTKKILPIA